MSELWIGAGTALWLGLLTSISPCPLATNIAAVSFIGRQVSDRRRAVAGAVAYVLGRSVAYALVGALLVVGILSTPGVSAFLSRHMNQVLGPILVLIGGYLLDLLSFGWSFHLGNEGLRQRAAKSGLVGAFGLGALFALSFCPISAALFFGSLLPLAVKQGSVIGLPVLYGVGTGLPVLGAALVLAFGLGAMGSILERVERVQKIAQRVTGAVFVAVGVYYTVRFIFLA